MCSTCRFATCQSVIDDDSSAASGVYGITIGTTVYPTWCEMINGKGWALIIRADGTKNTWGYDNAIWTDTSTLNIDEYTTGISDTTTEYKSPLFSVYAYSELRLGMRINGATNCLEVKHAQYSSMRGVMNGGQVMVSGTTRNDWLALANNGATQTGCTRIGYNLVPAEPSNVNVNFKVRIGLHGDDNLMCQNPDSFIGFGGSCLFR